MLDLFPWVLTGVPLQVGNTQLREAWITSDLLASDESISSSALFLPGSGSPVEQRCAVERGSLFYDTASPSSSAAPSVLPERKHKHILFPELVNQQVLCGWWGRKSYSVISNLGVNCLLWIAWLTRLSSAWVSRERHLSEVNLVSPFKVASKLVNWCYRYRGFN